MSDPIIKVIDLHKSLGGVPVLNGVNLEIERGKTTVIIGRSGGGKSVLLKHLIGLIKPDKGKILVDNENIVTMKEKELNRVRKKFGMVFQNAALFDSMTVGENVAFPLIEHRKLKKEEIRQIVEEKLLQVGLKGVYDKYPDELSGGMKKRVGLARALVLQPEIILYDEPTTGLDPLMTDAINNLIYKMGKELSLTNFVISHDIPGTFKIADKIAMLYGGKIIAFGTPDEIKNIDNPYLQQFLSGSEKGPIDILSK